MKRAVIISGGSIENYDFTKKFINEDDYIICADSGMVHCDKMNLISNVWVGDFDSCCFENLSHRSAAKNSKIIKLLPEKDDTDTEFACNYAYKNGFNEIMLLGGCGSRIDHMLSNIFLMEKMLDFAVNMVIVNEHNRMRILRNSVMQVNKSCFKYVSVIPLSGTADGVSNNGFKYPLSDETLFRNASRGVSNELVADSGTITVKNGTVLVVESMD